MTSRAAYSRPQSFPIENTPNSLRRLKNKTQRSYKKESDTVKTDETKSIRPQPARAKINEPFREA
jgi:hypothetical protein